MTTFYQCYEKVRCFVILGLEKIKKSLSKNKPDLVFPFFKYHPNPVETGSILASDEECSCCRAVNGYLYSLDEDEEAIVCPWCIANGKAWNKYKIEFVDAWNVEVLNKTILKELERFTPGFWGWQSSQWFACCDDACRYLGKGGVKEFEKYGKMALDAIRQGTGLKEEEWNSFLNILSRSSPTAYLFQCLHCDKYYGYTDCD